MNNFFFQALERRFTDNDFRSLLKNIAIRTNIARGKKRPNNASVFNQTNTGELIESADIRDFISKLNKEIQIRNNFYSKNKSYQPVSGVTPGNLFQSYEILAQPYTDIQIALESIIGDGYPDFDIVIPSDFELIKLNQKVLFLSYGEKLARIEFTASRIENINGDIRITYNQSQNWFSDGRSNINYNYDDLLYILRHAGSKDIRIGIADFSTKNIKWSNNAYLKASTLRLEELPNTNNANKSMQKQVISGYLDISLDQELEKIVAEKLKGSVITASRINKFKEYLNRAEIACLCDCNYCTCDCNYCTCDCNYCTCNCNYCTCDCNYCTCDCNYCTCNNNREYTDRTNIFNGPLCTCNADRYCPSHTAQYGGRWLYRNIYLTACSCQNDRSIPIRNEYGTIVKYTCRCNSNYVNKIVQQATVTQTCACNIDKQWTKNITGKAIWDKKSTGQIDNIVNNNQINQSNAITTRVCICHTNTTVRETCPTNKTMSYKANIGSSAYTCVCNINRNRVIACSANSDYKIVTDYTQFTNR